MWHESLRLNRDGSVLGIERELNLCGNQGVKNARPVVREPAQYAMTPHKLDERRFALKPLTQLKEVVVQGASLKRDLGLLCPGLPGTVDICA